MSPTPTNTFHSQLTLYIHHRSTSRRIQTLSLPTASRDPVASLASSKINPLAQFDTASSLSNRHDLTMRDGDDDGLVVGSGGRSWYDVSW
jgi:hypothetical protein